MINPDEILDVINRSGHTDQNYLKAHLARFINTFSRVDGAWDKERGVRLLDIGAHWLHQAVVFRLGGYEVIAADVPATLEDDSVKNLAADQDIELLSYTDLWRPGSLSSIPSDSINIVLMAEIIEHITFNPIEMWKEIYRVLMPNGRIVVTTPNYYRVHGHAWQFKRFIKGFGSGISTHEIVSVMTMGHHWKEFSLRELQHYFCMLSRDFVCIHHEFTHDGPGLSSKFQEVFKWFRQGLHIEIELHEKTHGIEVEPGW